MIVLWMEREMLLDRFIKRVSQRTEMEETGLVNGRNRWNFQMLAISLVFLRNFLVVNGDFLILLMNSNCVMCEEHAVE